MTPFQSAYVQKSEVQAGIESTMALWRSGEPTVRNLWPGLDEAEVREKVRALVEDEHRNSECWINDTYQVFKRAFGDFIHLSIKRLDKAPIHDWRDMQAIKNALVGEECEGVELYPAESRLVDSANQYHLWCSSNITFRFPFGFSGVRLVANESHGKAVQRPR